MRLISGFPVAFSYDLELLRAMQGLREEKIPSGDSKWQEVRKQKYLIDAFHSFLLYPMI